MTVELNVSDDSISKLQLSTRSSRALARSKITTITQLCSYTENDILRIRNLGVKSLNEIESELLKINCTLQPPKRKRKITLKKI